MAITIQEDFDDVDGGNALLTLPASIAGDDASLHIRRLAGEPDKLGPNGWQPHDVALSPQAVSKVNGRSVLCLGPELTQYLHEDTEIEISVPALMITERVIWPYITPSVHADGGRGAVVTAKPPEAFTKTNEVEQGHADPVDPVNPIDPPDQDGKPEPVDPPEPGRTTPEPSPFKLWWLFPIAAVLALVLVYSLSLDRPPEVTTEVATNDDTNTLVEEETPAARVADTRESLMEEAANCRESGCDGEAYHDIATRLTDIGVSDVFAIMSLAAEGGSVAAMEWLARSYDPLHFVENEGLQAPDLDSAFLYYGQASEAGSASASQDVASLCAALASADSANWIVEPDGDAQRLAKERNCQ